MAISSKKVLKNTIEIIGIQSPAEFREQIEEEYLRATRTKQFFSVAVFDLDPELMETSHGEFVFNLLKRARESDIVGWFDESRIGVLLPDTNREGADKLIESLKTLSTEGDIPACTYYIYPSSKW